MSDLLKPGLRASERRLRRAAPGFAQGAFLQAQARAELLRRLEPMQLKPAKVLDLGGGPGLGARALAQRYRQSSVVLVDSSEAMLASAVRARGWWRRFECVRADATALPFADASVDLVVAGFLLPFLTTPAALFAEVRRVLQPRGYFAFTTVGAVTLRELRHAFASVDNQSHVNEFPDFLDIGDALTSAGFVAPVLDADRLTVTYESLADVCRDLRAAGASPPTHGRSSLTGARRWAAATAAFEAARGADGRIPVTCELVYGQAWCPDGDATRATAGGHEVVVPLTRLRRR